MNDSAEKELLLQMSGLADRLRAIDIEVAEVLLNLIEKEDIDIIKTLLFDYTEVTLAHNKLKETIISHTVDLL